MRRTLMPRPRDGGFPWDSSLGLDKPVRRAKAYALDIKNYERQTDAAGAARAAAAVWATAPKNLAADAPAQQEPQVPDPNTDPQLEDHALDPFPPVEEPPATNGDQPASS